MRDCHQYLFQRPGRTDRLHARRCLSLLHAYRNGLLGVGVISSGEEGSAAVEGSRELAAGLCVGLGGMMRFLKHLWRLLREFGMFAWHNKAWWIIPVIVVLLLLARSAKRRI